MSVLPSMNTTGADSGTPPNPLAGGTLPKVPALDNTFGAVLLGTFVGLILYGVTLHQAYRYSRTYPNDGRVLKGLVIFILILETGTSIFSMHVCYFYLATNYFNPPALLYGIWSIDLFPLASGVVMVASQSFFARRVWLVGGRYAKALVIFAGLLCVAEIGFFIAATVEAEIIPTFAGFRSRTWLVSTGSTMAVSADILLTIMLTVLLHRSRTGVKRTDTMIDTLIMYSVNTGLLTGLFNLLSLLFAFIRPGELIYIGVGIPGVKMYATTLLAALNSRQHVAAHGSGLSNDTHPFGLGGTATVVGRSVRTSKVAVHTPQLRSGRTRAETTLDDTSVDIELKVPAHYAASARRSDVGDDDESVECALRRGDRNV
ncbi:hypothetical protein BC628DRAFT_415230 [Trametes gibbosa]|nr:hypothetical protein BC628DRAFT_415230 [Trametes gibbosa]